MNAKEKSAKARAYFDEGYNCAQSVAMAFAEELGMSALQIAKLTTGFGAGMGRMREVCGSVSGMVFVISGLFGTDDAKDVQTKTEAYRQVQAAANRFKEQNGSIICRELLKGIPTTPGVTPENRNTEAYRKRPCDLLVEDSAAILANILNELKEKGE